MSSKSTDLDGEKLLKVKKTLRALLLSSKGGCTLRSLSDDYKYLYGQAIPHKELGFSSLLDLLHHMKDVVLVQRRHDGIRLFGIADESTRHIARMVAKQSGGKKGRTSVPTHPTVSMVTRRGTSWAIKDPPLPKPPLTFQAQLKTLFLSYPNGVALHDFAEAFARRFGYYFGFRGWGFSSLEQVLRSIPEIITMETDQERSCLIVKLVKGTSGKREGLSEGVRRPSPDAVNSQKLDLSASVEVPRSQAGTESLNSLELSPRKMATPATPSSKAATTRRRITVPKKVVGQIETILRAFPAGIWISRFPVQFKKYFDEDLPVSALGFSSVVHMLTSTPVCEVERPTGVGDWLVFRKGGPRPKVADNHQFLHEAYVSDKLVKDIHKLMRLHQKGIPLNKFVSKFEEVTQCELPVEEMGFNSITELLQKVPGIDVSKPPDSTKLMVFCTTPITDSETESSSDSGEKMSAKEKDALLSDVSSQNKPRSVYLKQALPSKDVRMCPVYITHVKTPSCFSIQLIGERTTKALETLHEDMATFFNSKEGDSYAIKEPYVGQACCSIFNNDGYWYRSEVTSLPAFDVVEVHYVDYGNSAQVPLASLRRPKAHYLTLPAQSISCRLANLKPAGSTWSRTATQLLYQMTKDKAIVAIISSIQENCMSVCLCDTNTDRDIHINDCLCNQGLAIFNADTLEDQKDFDGYQLESPTLISADKEDVRSPGDLGKIASVSLKSMSSAQPTPTPPSSTITTTIRPSSSTTQPLPTPSSSTPFLTNTPTTISPSLDSAGLPARSANVNENGAAQPFPYSAAALPPLQQMSLTQQLQMQNYMYLQQLLLAQQNAMFGGGAMPTMVPLQRVVNPLASQPARQTGLGNGQVNFPPPPGFVQNRPVQHKDTQQATVSLGKDGVVQQNANGQTSQTGLTNKLVSPSPTSVSTVDHQNPSQQASQTGLTSVTHSAPPRTDQAPPTTTESSTHDQSAASHAHQTSSSTHPSEAAAVPSPSKAAVVMCNTGSAQNGFSSSLSSPTDDSSSLSSEGETLQSSHKLGSCAESCLADSESESQGSKMKKKTSFVAGESTLFFSGGTLAPSWAKEKAFIKRVTLTPAHSLSVLRHDDKAYFLSTEVSSWFWESDLLQSMLRQVQKPCWGLLMTERKNRKLFQTLRRVQATSQFVGSRQQVTVYMLEDLPQIIKTFSAPNDLCTAVTEQVEAWQVLGLTYFTLVSSEEVQLLEKMLAQLKEEKRSLVQVIMTEDEGQESLEEDEEGTNSSFARLKDVRKRIADISKKLTKLKRVAGASLSSKRSESSCSSGVGGSDSASFAADAKLSSSNVPEPVGEVEGCVTVLPEAVPDEVKGQVDTTVPAPSDEVKGQVDSTVHLEVEDQIPVCSSDHTDEVKGHFDTTAVSAPEDIVEVKGQASVGPVNEVKGDSSSSLEDAPPPVVDSETETNRVEQSTAELSGKELDECPLRKPEQPDVACQTVNEEWNSISETEASLPSIHTPTPSPLWSTIDVNSSPLTTGETPPTATPSHCGSRPPSTPPSIVPISDPVSSAVATPPASVGDCTDESNSQSLPAFSPSFSPVEFLPPGVPAATPDVGGEPPVRRRPVGIGRGGRPLSPLDARNVHVGRAGMYPPGKPIVRVSPRPQQVPYYFVPQPQYVPRGKGLLPLPGPHYGPAPPMVTPIPISPEERWIYMNHRRQYVYRNGKPGDFPPMGSGAGLDII